MDRIPLNVEYSSFCLQIICCHFLSSYRQLHTEALPLLSCLKCKAAQSSGGPAFVTPLTAHRTAARIPASQHAQSLHGKVKQSLPGRNIIVPVSVVIIFRISCENIPAVEQLPENLPPKLRDGCHGGALHFHGLTALFPPVSYHFSGLPVKAVCGPGGTFYVGNTVP